MPTPVTRCLCLTRGNRRLFSTRTFFFIISRFPYTSETPRVFFPLVFAFFPGHRYIIHVVARRSSQRSFPKTLSGWRRGGLGLRSFVRRAAFRRNCSTNRLVRSVSIRGRASSIACVSCTIINSIGPRPPYMFTLAHNTAFVSI